VNVVLSAATLADAPAISGILAGWVDETPWLPRIRTPQQDRQIGQWLMEKMPVTVARKDGALPGFMAQRGDEIHALYIAPEARGAGVGGALLANAKSQSERLALWCHQANTGARRFYARHGFEEIQTSDGQGNDEKLPDVYLVWTQGTP